MLEEGYFGPSEGKQREKVHRMVSAGVYLLGLIREYLDLA
jgi:hypothetical protein